jgi:hypothetical protein
VKSESWKLPENQPENRIGAHREHVLIYLTGGRTLFGNWFEEWRCRGCGIRFFFKGRSVHSVGSLTAKLQREHSDYMSFTAVFNQLTEFRWAGKAVKVKFKSDLTRSIYGPRDIWGLAVKESKKGEG